MKGLFKVKVAKEIPVFLFEISVICVLLATHIIMTDYWLKLLSKLMKMKLGVIPLIGEWHGLSVPKWHLRILSLTEQLIYHNARPVSRQCGSLCTIEGSSRDFLFRGQRAMVCGPNLALHLFINKVLLE